ncbi:gamma-glutamyltransferase, partial [bacterium]|nr:gamma-glutamyltransferase [bacterium]
WLQYGRPPKPGELLYQKDLAKTLRLLVEAEQRALNNGLNRRAALKAARDVFYKGEIAQAIDKLYRENGGLVRYDDLANYKGEWEKPVHTTYKGIDIYTVNTATQGPIMIEMFNMLENYDVKELGHNSTEYIHLLSQIINLAMSDRYHYYGDPNFVEIPNGLFTKEYAKELIKKIDPDKAQPEMPPKNDPYPFSTNLSSLDSYSNAVAALPETSEESGDTDTTFIAVMDKEGNCFAMTPSDGHINTPLIPGYGFGLTTRGRRFMRVDGHPADIAPGKRPLNTTNPSVALKDGEPYML